MKNETKQSFILFHEYSELINELSNEQAGELLKAVFEYEITSKTPELHGMTKIVFIKIRQDLDRNAAKYEEKCKRMKENGKKGGRPPKNTVSENKEALQKNQMVFSKTKKSLYDNDNDNDNVNDNDNDKSSLVSNSEEKNTDAKSYLSDEQKPLLKEEREILENYLKDNFSNIKYPKAYLRKIINNGDYADMLENAREYDKKLQYLKKIKEKNIEEQKQLKIRQEKELAEQEAKNKKFKYKLLSKKMIKLNIESISDKHSAASVLSNYYQYCKSPPKDFDDIVKTYDLDSLEKVEDCLKEYAMNKCREIANRIKKRE